MEPTHAFPVGWCAVRTPHKGCVETHFHTTTISIFSNTISNNFNYPTCLHLSSCWLWRWHDFLSWLVLKCTIPGNKPWEILDDGCGLKDPSFKCSKVLPSCHDGQMEDIDSNCVFQVLKAQVKKNHRDFMAPKPNRVSRKAASMSDEDSVECVQDLTFRPPVLWLQKNVVWFPFSLNSLIMRFPFKAWS